MAKFPALPLWTDAYLADTLHLDDAQHGLYLRLLILMWRSPHCRIPNDDEWLARAFHHDLDAVQQKLRPLIAEFCQPDRNWITQKRLQKEWNFCSEISNRNKAAADSRWSKWRAEKAALAQSVSHKPLENDDLSNTGAYASVDSDASAYASASLRDASASQPPESLKKKSKSAYASNGVCTMHGPDNPLKTNGSTPHSRNAPKPLRKKERKKDAAAPPASGHQEVEVELFTRGKEILGNDAGGLIARLLKAKGNAHLALAAILTAATKQNPREYVAAMLRGSPSGGAFYDPAI